VLRLRAALREFFPAALEAFADLDSPDTLERYWARHPVPIGRRLCRLFKFDGARHGLSLTG
jgi:hypothetical protein